MQLYSSYNAVIFSNKLFQNTLRQHSESLIVYPKTNIYTRDIIVNSLEMYIRNSLNKLYEAIPKYTMFLLETTVVYKSTIQI